MTGQKDPIGKSASDAFQAIVHSRYGEPNDVLELVELPKSNLTLGPSDVLISVSKRPIHPGDLHMIRGAPNGGPAAPIAEGTTRGPGFEGVGVVEKLGDKESTKGRFSIGQRVAFFSGAARAWATYVKVPAEALVALPDNVEDDTAAQLLINSITARAALKVGHNSLPPDFKLPVSVLETAAGSSVMRLMTAFAIPLGVRPIRLVRTTKGAKALLALQPGSPVVSTEESDWKDQVKALLGDKPLHVAMDAVGGALVNDLADLLDVGGAIVNFGWLGDGAPDLSSFAPRGLSFRGANMGSWAGFTAEEKKSHLDSAIKLAQESPELFEVAGSYQLSDFRAAIAHVTRPGKSGIVMLTN